MQHFLKANPARRTPAANRSLPDSRKPSASPMWQDNRPEAATAAALQRMTEARPVAPPVIRSRTSEGTDSGVQITNQDDTESREYGGKTVIQRAITIGTQPVPRTVNLDRDTQQQLTTEGLFGEFQRLNDEREKIYIFGSADELIGYLRHLKGVKGYEQAAAPLVHSVTPEQLEEGHERAQDIRFNSIYQPSTQQISGNAPGTHQIAPQMMPPSGQGHHWGQMPIPGSGQEYVLYQNRLQPPSQTSMPLTFGNPLAPSLVMNQGGMTQGMHIQPTTSSYIDPITRSQSTYGGISSESGRVRGHPFALEQNQISTDHPSQTFDNDPRTYTSESDSTKSNGGTSSWRYNQIEKPSFQSGTPFTQVNNDSVMGGMGIGEPSSMHYRMPSSSGGYTDLHMDNSGTVDYRGTDSVRPKGMGKQTYQTEMGKQSALGTPYVETPIHRPGEDFTDPSRHSYPGYMSPPPSPFLSYGTLMEAEEIEIYPIAVHVGSRVTLSDGREGQVTEILDRDLVRGKARCKVMPLQKDFWNPKGY